MTHFYANLTVAGPERPAVLEHLNARHDAAYVSPVQRGALVVFHADLSNQEDLARRLSQAFDCPVLLAMVFAQSIFLYNLYQHGEQIDAYVSSPHDGLDLAGPAPLGNADLLCAAFDAERSLRRVRTLLDKPSRPGQPFEHAINRHGELARALGLPLCAVGCGYSAIELGELPEAPGFEVGELLRTG